MPALKKKLGYTNLHQVPRLEKIVVTSCIGKSPDRKVAVEDAVDEIQKITGQRPSITFSKKAVANFKLREGEILGARVTLRGARMWEFLHRFINITAPNIRDFRGISVQVLRRPRQLRLRHPGPIDLPGNRNRPDQAPDRFRPDLRHLRPDRCRRPRPAHRARHAVPRHEESHDEAAEAAPPKSDLPHPTRNHSTESPPWQFSPIPSPISSRVSRTPAAPATRNSPLPTPRSRRTSPASSRRKATSGTTKSSPASAPQLKVKPKFIDGRPVLTDLKRVSTPGRRHYVGCRRNPARHVRPRHLHPFHLERRDVRRQRQTSETRRRTPRQRLVNP